MPRILSVGGDNPFKTLWERFNSLDKFTKLFIITALLIVFVTPFIITNYQTIKSRGESPRVLTSPNTPQFVSDEVLLKFKDATTPSQQEAILKENNATLSAEIPPIKVKVLKVNEHARDAVIEALSHNPAVEFAERNGIAQATFMPNDPSFSLQWGMTMVKAPEAWDTTTGLATVPVAILDTGVNQDHPDLAGKIVTNRNFTTTASFDDVYGHGTHVAGIASANTDNGLGVAGLGYNSGLVNAKVLDNAGYGSYSEISNGIVWAVDNGAKVISMSLGGTSSSSTLQSAVNYGWNKGAVVVAAAGNSGTTSPLYPAYYQSVIAVAATDSTDQLTSWSNRGSWVDVAAPGSSIYSTCVNGSYCYMSGTSMATPYVSGLAALLFTTVSDTNGNGFLNDEVRSCIESTADNIGMYNISGGRMNAYKAVLCSPNPTDTTPPSVTIISPSNGSVVSSGSFTVQATASDNVAVSRVEYYKDSDTSPFATVFVSPYSAMLPSLPNGAHVLLAKAYDSSNNTGTSSVSFTVDKPDDISPSTSITSPANGSYVSGTVTLNADAYDNTGVFQVEFYRNSELLGTDGFYPFSFIWDTSGTSGQYNLQSKAYDRYGNLGNSALVLVTVDNVPPVVSITAPSSVTRGSQVNITALATDNIAVSRVDFYVNSTLICSDTAALYSCNWNVPKAKKTYQVSAIAYDLAGNTTVTKPLQVTTSR